MHERCFSNWHKLYDSWNLEKLTKTSFLPDIGKKVRKTFTRESYIIKGIQGIPPQNNILICNLQVQCTLRFCDAVLGV